MLIISQRDIQGTPTGHTRTSAEPEECTHTHTAGKPNTQCTSGPLPFTHTQITKGGAVL